MQREAFIRARIDTAGRSLEIGPGYNPILPKRDGHAVETADYTTQVELQAKYRNEPGIDWQRIEPVDYVLSAGGLLEAIQHRAHYDTIIASNVIEHVPDLLGFLQDCSALLQPSGTLLLVNPDKRHCFDAFRPVSSTGQVLQAHLDRRTRHAPGTLFDHVANYADRDGIAAWGRQGHGTVRLRHDLRDAWNMAQEAQTAAHYIDAHAWVFVPSSFRLIARDLHALDLTDLREAEFIPAFGLFEFLVTLTKSGPGCPRDRLSLCRDIVREQARARPSGSRLDTLRSPRRLVAAARRMLGAGMRRRPKK